MERETLVQDIVESANTYPDRLDEVLLLELAVLDEGGEVHASEETGTSCGQGLLGTGVGSGVGVVGELAEEVPVGDPVPVEASGLTVIPVGMAELLEELGGVQVLGDVLVAFGAVETLDECAPVPDALHELVGDTDGHVRLGYPLEVGLDGHELLEVGVVTCHGEHEGSPASVLTDESGDHGEQVGEGYGSGGLGCGVVDLRTAGRELGDVDPRASTVAEGTGEPARTLEDGFDGILWGLKDVTVGICDLEAALVESSVGKDPATEKELLLSDHTPNVGITVADTVKPLVEGLPVVTVLLGPYVHSKLIVTS